MKSGRQRVEVGQEKAGGFASPGRVALIEGFHHHGSRHGPT
ncbi:hypothetical protein [Streptomyces sp. NBC_01800]|nr:hypothetical protein [Streptomyces sp. NBC_01800]WSA68848.1 hypothetical protein OIE65_18680 [Streptomyces sp. NBC_01800]